MKLKELFDKYGDTVNKCFVGLMILAAWVEIALGAYFKDYHVMSMGFFIILLYEFKNSRLNYTTINVNIEDVVYKALKLIIDEKTAKKAEGFETEEYNHDV